MKYYQISAIALSISALIGCGPIDNPKCMTGCDTKTDQTDQFGLTLKPSDRMYIPFEEISSLYQDTMACMGMTAAPPTVQFTSFSVLFFALAPDTNGGGGAVYIVPQQMVVINTDLSEVHTRDDNSDREFLTHEYIHHILRINNAVNDSVGHTSSLFEQCIIEDITR